MIFLMYYTKNFLALKQIDLMQEKEQYKIGIKPEGGNWENLLVIFDDVQLDLPGKTTILERKIDT